MMLVTDFNAKVTEIEGKIPCVSSNTALTAVENKIPDVSSLVKKTDYNTRNLKLKLKIKLMITIMTNTLLLQNLILWQQMFLKQD